MARSFRTVTHVSLLWAVAFALVDESGRYYAGSPMQDLVPPEPSESDREASVDLSKQPVEKLFRLLYYELSREDQRPRQKHLQLYEFQVLTQELKCHQQLQVISQESAELADESNSLHLNVTGTSGLYWLLHKHPEEHSWAWLLTHCSDKMFRKVQQHFVRLLAFAAEDKQHCISPSFRTVLMNAATTWKRLIGDYNALLWNAVAFGILGDVTSWRELDEDGQAADEPGGPPPNVSWSENLIFGNMWLSSVAKFLEHHQKEVAAHAYQELMTAQQSEAKGLRYEFNAGAEHKEGNDGVISSFEYLRRQQFLAWTLDKGLLQAILRHCLKPGYGNAASITVGDFGAGGGRYSQWLNDTGLVQAYAYDASQSVQDITGGSVQQVDLSKPDLSIGRSFDWIMCLDVLSRIPDGKVTSLLRNIGRHVLKGGLILSWGRAVIGGSSTMSEQDIISLVEKETGLRHDGETSGKLRAGCDMLDLKTGSMVFRVA